MGDHQLMRFMKCLMTLKTSQLRNLTIELNMCGRSRMKADKVTNIVIFLMRSVKVREETNGNETPLAFKIVLKKIKDPFWMSIPFRTFHYDHITLYTMVNGNLPESNTLALQNFNSFE